MEAGRTLLYNGRVIKNICIKNIPYEALEVKYLRKYLLIKTLQVSKKERDNVTLLRLKEA